MKSNEFQNKWSNREDVGRGIFGPLFCEYFGHYLAENIFGTDLVRIR